MGWKTELATDIAGFSFAEATLRMAKGSARKGFHVPGTNIFGIRDKITSKYGTKLAGWGAIGPGHATDAAKALTMFEQGGLRGFAATAREVGSKFATKSIAKNIGARYLIGRAAGIALTGANFVLGATMAYDIIKGTYDVGAAIESKYHGIEFGGNYQDSQGAATSRQRALQAITASSLQARSAIGNEAMLMHR